jgi:flagella basal body P-ring formation protein FlgA
MIIKYLGLFIFLSLTLSSAFACEVQLPHQMLVFSADQSEKNIYHIKNCESNVTDELHQIISGLEGRIAAFQLKEMMNTRGYQIEITPHSVVIQQFRTVIRDQLLLPPGVQVKETRSINMPGILALPAGDKIEVNCSGCLYGTQQTLNVTVLGFDGSRQTHMASADFKKMVKAFRLTAALPSFSSVSDTTILKEEYIETIPHTDLITDVETLKFYKTNKPLKAGEILKKSDLNAVNLVRAGLKTDVVLENQMIRIKTSGISRGNGTIGELVEVYHPQKNKKYQGRVIDINKVLVEL